MPTPSISPSVFAAYYAKANTRRNFICAIKKYLSACLEHPVSDIDAGMSEYLSSRDMAAVSRDLTGFFTLPGIKSLAPVSRSAYLGMVETYFRDCCDYVLPPLNQKLRRRSSPGAPVPLTKDYPVSREMLQKLIAVASPRLRCEILVCCSSGLRISELLSLRFEDVFLDEVPARVVIRAENAKNKKERHSFLSSEAAAALRLYYTLIPAERAAHTVNGCRRVKNYVVDTSLVFPYSRNCETVSLCRAADAAGLGERDKTTGRHLLHFHSFRKWFITQGKKSARADYIEMWAGHTGYLSGSYFRPTPDEERAEYLKCELDLSVSVPEDYLKIKGEQASQIQKLQASVSGYQEAISLLQAQINELKNRQPSGVVSVPAWVLPDD